MSHVGILVQPLINLLRDRFLEYDIIQMDETTVQVLKEPVKQDPRSRGAYDHSTNMINLYSNSGAARNRVMASDQITDQAQKRLKSVHQSLNPFRPKKSTRRNFGWFSSM